MKQKGDPYTKLFSTLSRVRLMPCILSQLNILCSNLVKPSYTKITIYPLFTVHTLRPFYVLSNVLDFIKVEQSMYKKTFNTSSGVQSVLNFTAIRYSLHKCSETILCLKRQLTVHVSPVSRALGFTEARKICHIVVWTLIWSIFESFAIKVVSSRLP